jgi:hypothetical protein
MGVFHEAEMRLANSLAMAEGEVGIEVGSQSSPSTLDALASAKLS